MYLKNIETYVITFLGATRHFWGKPNKRPNWWPVDIPFENVARRTFTKAKLLKVLTSYKLSNSETSNDCTETIRDRSPIHSCVNISEIEETADMYPSLEDQDVVTISESSSQDNPEVSDLLNQTFELSNDSFLPGLSAPLIVTVGNPKSLPRMFYQHHHSLSRHHHSLLSPMLSLSLL